MLLCDGCPHGLHQGCGAPDPAPKGDWYCDICVAAGKGQAAVVAAPNLLSSAKKGGGIMSFFSKLPAGVKPMDDGGGGGDIRKACKHQRSDEENKAASMASVVHVNDAIVVDVDSNHSNSTGGKTSPADVADMFAAAKSSSDDDKTNATAAAVASHPVQAMMEDEFGRDEFPDDAFADLFLKFEETQAYAARLAEMQEQVTEANGAEKQQLDAQLREMEAKEAKRVAEAQEVEEREKHEKEQALQRTRDREAELQAGIKAGIESAFEEVIRRANEGDSDTTLPGSAEPPPAKRKRAPAQKTLFGGFMQSSLASFLQAAQATPVSSSCDCGRPEWRRGGVHSCRFYGTFVCAKNSCRKRWTSANAYKGYKQHCRKCDTETLATTLRPLEKGKGLRVNKSGLGHDWCEKCEERGYSCDRR